MPREVGKQKKIPNFHFENIVKQTASHENTTEEL